MQPVNRPPGPPFDQRGIVPPPTGMPAQMRPPQGFRPPQMQPGIPSTFCKPPDGPPIQKMANMNLGPKIPPFHGNQNPGQMFGSLSNGVQNTAVGAMQQQHISTSREQDNMVHSQTGQSEYPINSGKHLCEDQKIENISPATFQDDSRSPLNNFSIDRNVLPQPAAQSSHQNVPPQNISTVIHPSTPTEFQSTGISNQASGMGISTKSNEPLTSTHMSGSEIDNQSSRPIASPLMSATGIQNQFARPTASPLMSATGIQNQFARPTASPLISGPGIQNQPARPGASPLMSAPGIQNQPSRPGASPLMSATGIQNQPSRPGASPHMSTPGIQNQPSRPGASPHMSAPGMQNQHLRPGASPLTSAHGIQYQPSRPVSSFMSGTASQSDRPIMSPKLSGQGTEPVSGMSPHHGPLQSYSRPDMPQPPEINLTPRHPHMTGMAQRSQQGIPQQTTPVIPPQSFPGTAQPNIPGIPQTSAQYGSSSQPYEPNIPPQAYGTEMPPKIAGQNLHSPIVSNSAGSPLMHPSGFGMPPGASMGPQGIPPSSGFGNFPGQLGATSSSTVNPRMSAMPGMQSRMPSQPATMPPSGSVLSPNIPPHSAGQQQYTPQQGGMQNRYPSASPQPAGMGGYAQSQGRKLNPDDMPSPLQVIEEDMHHRSGEFITNVKGTLPPLVTTDFHVTDGGNTSPRFIRSTMYSIPGTPDLMKQAAVPFGLVISPMANLLPNEAPLYLGTSLANGPVRCNRCKAYMSPLMVFMDGGSRFQCLLCKQTNDVPSDYYCHMDSMGARADKFQRPELCLGSFEYVATPEYCRDKLLPKEPAFIFVMEMTQMMLQRGVINLVCQNMKEILGNLPIDQVPGEEIKKSKVHVGFITYDSSVHFYKLSGLSPEMCVVCDKDSFVPVPDGILCEPEEVAHNIDKLMESIPQNFQSARETSGNLYGAIHAGMAALKASGRPGKLFVFHSSLPHGEGIGKLKSREDRKLLGTEKEKVILSPQTSQYGSLAQDLVTAGCGVDLYLFNESYIDLATLGQVSKLTGGQCYKYTYFTLNKDGPRLLDDLKINVGRNIAFESVMRVRTSTGVRPVEFYGHFFMSNTHDIELAVVDSSKGVVVEIKHDDKLTEEEGVYVQAALLYTSCGGQRRLRILNLSFNVCTQMADLFKSCDNDTLMNFLCKESMFKFFQTNSKQVKSSLITRTAQILSCYRRNCASPSSVGQLILPELLKLLPLYINCLSKSDALSGGSDITCDDRSWHIYQLCTMDVGASSVYLYPRLIPLSDTDPKETSVPHPLRTSYDKLRPDGVFLLENGLFMFIWVGSGTSSAWMTDVFGVAAPHHLDPVISELPELDNPISIRVRGIIESIRQERGLHLRLFVVPQNGKHELVLRNYLVEDKGIVGSPSYVEFLCHIHKEVRAILS